MVAMKKWCNHCGRNRLVNYEGRVLSCSGCGKILDCIPPDLEEKGLRMRAPIRTKASGLEGVSVDGRCSSNEAHRNQTKSVVRDN